MEQNAMPLATLAICTYNRADRLPALAKAMLAQQSPIPFEVLFINNNSNDNTAQVLQGLAERHGNVRFVTETEQGIVPARNRAIAESLGNDYMLFMDDDQLPAPGWVANGLDALMNEDADCVGGRIVVSFTPPGRPPWLEAELLGFLGELDNGPEAAWVSDHSKPVWSGNVGYAMRYFRDKPDLRFDRRYNRAGHAIGGGSDHIMFNNLLARQARIRYRPDMVVEHFVDGWKLKRGYFLKLHYRAGLRHGLHELPGFARALLGVPPFLVVQFLKHGARAAAMQLTGRPGALRQAMNAAHAWGALVGYVRRS